MLALINEYLTSSVGYLIGHTHKDFMERIIESLIESIIESLTISLMINRHFEQGIRCVFFKKSLSECGV